MNLILYFKIDSSEIIALDQRSKKLFVYNTENGEQIIQDLPSFDRGFIISDSTLILTSIDSKSKDRIFFRYNTLTHQSVIIETTLPKVGDMGFSSDGFFEYSTDSNLLIYVLYGKGRYLLFDKELKSVESSNTIDQFRFNPFVIQKGSKFFLSRRSVSINSLAALNKKYIFIISMARSLKDKKNGLDGNIIDVYSNTYPHEYKGSIFLDKEVIGNIKNFQVDNNYMYFMNSEEIIKMCLPKSINQYNKNYFHDKYLK